MAYERFRKIIARHFHYQGLDGRKGTSKSGMAKAVRRFLGLNVPRNHPLTPTLSQWERAAKGIFVYGNHLNAWIKKALDFDIENADPKQLRGHGRQEQQDWESVFEFGWEIAGDGWMIYGDIL